MALAAALALFTESVPLYAAQQSDAVELQMQQEISNLEKQTKQTQDAINNLQGQKAETQNNVNSLQSYSNSLQDKVNQYNDKLDDINSAISDARNQWLRFPPR